MTAVTARPDEMVPRSRAPQGIYTLLALVMLLSGFGLRLLDLDDPPLDYHPSRQLFSYTIARGLYYQWSGGDDPVLRQRAVEAYQAADRYEPRILEGAVAGIYVLFGGERFVVARVVTSMLWVLGGWLLFRLASAVSSPFGALLGLGYYLFIPFSVQASRSFQPDVLMVVGLVASASLFWRWSREPSWSAAILAGLIGGLTALAKAQGAFAVGSMALAAVLTRLGPARAITSRQVWMMAGLLVLIPGAYYFGPWDTPGGGYFRYFTVEMSQILRDPGFFVRWLVFIDDFMDLAVISLALVGSLTMSAGGRAISLGLWFGYGLLGLFFPWQIHTHDYYSLSLVPTVALGISPIGSILGDAIGRQRLVWRAAFVVVLVFAAALPAWLARSGMFGRSYRNEPAAWRNMGEALPRDGRIIGLTHDYGWRLQYWGYTPVGLWPYQADYALHFARGGNVAEDLRGEFERRTEGYDYFLVTDFGELRAQSQLQSILEGEFPVFQRGDGYILYDLRTDRPQ